jgi:hypothetical protein
LNFNTFLTLDIFKSFHVVIQRVHAYVGISFKKAYTPLKFEQNVILIILKISHEGLFIIKLLIQ